MRIYIFIYLLLALTSSCTTGIGNIELPYDQLREGDLVFRRGRNMTSNIIIAKDNYNYSHIGMLHKQEEGSWHVIHAVNEEYDFEGDFDRVKIDPIERFFSGERASAGAIAHSFIDDSTANAMSNQAIQYVKDSIRFDDSFNLDDSSELYCTELIYKLYKKINTDITEGRRTKAGIFGFPDEIIFPSDILKNKKLNIYFVY